MAVTFVAAGAGAADDGSPVSIAVPYPAGLADDDLLIAQIMSRNTASTIGTPPSGWTLLVGPDTGASTFRQWLYYKASDGTETGTETWTISGAALFMGRMYAFRGALLSSFAEDSDVATGNSTTVTCPAVTTSASDQLVVAFTAIADDNAQSDFTGETGGNLTEAVAEYTSTLGLDGSIGLQIAAMSSPGTISGGSMTIASDPWICRAFAIRLAGASTVPDAPVLDDALDGEGEIELTWSTPADGGSAITGYNIYRSTSTGTEVLVDTVGVVNTTIDAAVANHVYFYKVAAVNANGAGALSNEIFALSYGFENVTYLCGHVSDLAEFEPYWYVLEGLPPNTDIWSAERYDQDIFDNGPSWGSQSFVGTTDENGVLITGLQSGVTEPPEENSTPLSHSPNLIGYFIDVTPGGLEDYESAELFTQGAALGATSPVYLGVPVLSVDDVGDATVDLSWTTPSTCDAGSVIAYDIFKSSSPSFVSLQTPDATVVDTNTYTIPSPNGELMYFVVVARLGLTLDTGNVFFRDSSAVANPSDEYESNEVLQRSNIVSATPEGSALTVSLSVRVPLHGPPS